jgi:hypothetical protein
MVVTEEVKVLIRTDEEGWLFEPLVAAGTQTTHEWAVHTRVTEIARRQVRRSPARLVYWAVEDWQRGKVLANSLDC